ncbi:hypothetical protein ZWY2020_026628 [Hordeum vulgare]|nr:hypothetical protein ZWY2020_026628 [Hordeum vulgare]
MDGSSAEVATVMVKRAKTVLTVAAIPGSLRRASANTGLIRAAAKMCEESIPGLRIDHVDISDLPLLNTDLENVDGNAFPATVEDWVSASGSPAYHIRQVGVFLDIHFINKPEGFVSAHHPQSKFDDKGNLIDPETGEMLRKILLSLQAFALRLIHGNSAAKSGQGR